MTRPPPNSPADPEAMAIYQGILDETSEALIARDGETFLRRIFLPHVMSNEGGTVSFPDVKTARLHFERFSDAMTGRGIDAYTRIARAAWFTDKDHLIGQHESFMTARGKMIVPRFASEMHIELRDGIWGVTQSHHVTRYVAWPDLLPREDRP